MQTLSFITSRELDRLSDSVIRQRALKIQQLVDGVPYPTYKEKLLQFNVVRVSARIRTSK